MPMPKIFWNGPTIQRLAHRKLRRDDGSRVLNANHLAEAVTGLTIPTAYRVWQSGECERCVDTPTLTRLAEAFGLKQPWSLLEYHR